MKKCNLLIVILAAVSVAFVAQSMAQTRQPSPTPRGDTPASADEKMVQGQVRSIDPSEREITLTDGTTLVLPPGATLRPGALREGATVIARYREEQGKNVLIALALADPATPGSHAPSPAPPGESPKRY
jgi:NADPH-dependent 2,4-dienoyl-CoA reductase/sulfur reductase-like enzyme